MENVEEDPTGEVTPAEATDSDDNHGFNHFEYFE